MTDQRIMSPTGTTPETPETDDSTNPTTAAPEGQSSSSDEWRGSGMPAGQAAPGPRERLEPYVSQLQSMIENLSTQAAPTLREIAAKAAELAAVAGERAGPLAQKAAERTGTLGERVASKGKEVAADLRRGGQEPPTGPSWASNESTSAGGGASTGGEVTGSTMSSPSDREGNVPSF